MFPLRDAYGEWVWPDAVTLRTTGHGREVIAREDSTDRERNVCGDRTVRPAQRGRRSVQAQHPAPVNGGGDGKGRENPDPSLGPDASSP